MSASIEKAYANMWERCMLDGPELDRVVAALEGWVKTDTGVMQRMSIAGEVIDVAYPTDLVYHRNGALVMGIIERDHIFLEPPHSMHRLGGSNDGWHRINYWTATVSSAIRTIPNSNDPELPRVVGRGCGDNPRVAALRAYVVSMGWKP